jgi:hypothetical protein
VDKINHLERIAANRISGVRDYKQARTQSMGLFRVASHASLASNTNRDASAEEVKIHVGKTSKGGS